MAGSKKSSKGKAKAVECNLENSDAISSFLNKGAIKRLGYSAGCKRFELSVYETIRIAAKNELNDIMSAAIEDMGKQKTLQARNVVSAVQNQRNMSIAYSNALKEKVKPVKGKKRSRKPSCD
jgi:hypothetical protein